MDNQNMSERELLTDLLHTEKNMTTVYAGSCLECSSQELRRILLQNMTECSNDQYTVFDEMRRRSLYNPKTAPSQEVAAAKKNMTDLRNQTW